MQKTIVAKEKLGAEAKKWDPKVKKIDAKAKQWTLKLKNA